MIRTTVKDALDERKAIDNLAGHVIYLYRDEETILYIGRSISPCDRLREHMGMGRSAQSRLGMMIERHLPRSLEWTLEMYTLADCLPLVEKEYGGSHPYYQARLDDEEAFIQREKAKNAELESRMGKAFSWFEGLDYKTAFLNLLYHDIAHIAEETMIAYHHPCLNVLLNAHGSPLPEKYYGHVTVESQDMKWGKVE